MTRKPRSERSHTASSRCSPTPPASFSISSKGREGRDVAAAAGVRLLKGERISPFGDGWLLHSRGGFAPCPWAFELAHFTPARPGDSTLDLGTGTGVLLVALHQVYPDLGPSLGLELEPVSAGQAARNLRLGAVSGGVVRADIRTPPIPRTRFDLVVSNPPFYPVGWGRESSSSRAHRATHSVFGDVADFARAAAWAVKPRGHVVFVYDASRLTALLLGLAAAGLTVKRLQFLEDDRGQPARVLALAGRGGGGLSVGLLSTQKGVES